MAAVNPRDVANPNEAEHFEGDQQQAEAKDDSMRQPRARRLLQEVEHKAEIGNHLKIVWRYPNEQLWNTWVCKVIARDEYGKLQVLYTKGAGIPKTAVMWPPATPLRYKSITLEPSDDSQPSSQNDLASAMLADLWKRSRDETPIMGLIQSQQDVAAGHKSAMTQLANGIRIVASVANNDQWLVPHLWIDAGQEWQQVCREKFQEFGCTFRQQKLKADVDLDIMIMKELLQNGQRTTKEEYYVLYAVHWRIVEKFFLTCPLFPTAREQAENWSRDVSLAWDEGRLDPVSIFYKIIRSKSTSIAADPTPSQPAPYAGLRADKMEQKLDAIRESLRTSNSSVTNSAPSPPIIIQSPSPMSAHQQSSSGNNSRPHSYKNQKFRERPKNVQPWRKRSR